MFLVKFAKRVAVAVIIIVTLLVLYSSIVIIIGVFDISGNVRDWIWELINWGWLKEYQTLVLGTIGALLVIAGAIIALLQLWSTQRTSYADLLVQLAKEWNSDSFIESRQLLLEIAPIQMSEEQQRREIEARMREAERNKEREYFVLTRPLDFLEELAFLVNNNYIPLNDAQRSFGGPMLAYYELFEEYINEMRRQKGNEDAYIELQQVANKLKGQ